MAWIRSMTSMGKDMFAKLIKELKSDKEVIFDIFLIAVLMIRIC